MEKEKIHAAKAVFYICLAFAIGLMVGGFFVPPMGIIDGSILTACGILFLFASLGIFARSLDLNKSASFTKGDVKIDVGIDDNQQDGNNE